MRIDNSTSVNLNEFKEKIHYLYNRFMDYYSIMLFSAYIVSYSKYLVFFSDDYRSSQIGYKEYFVIPVLIVIMSVFLFDLYVKHFINSLVCNKLVLFVFFLDILSVEPERFKMHLFSLIISFGISLLLINGKISFLTLPFIVMIAIFVPEGIYSVLNILVITYIGGKDKKKFPVIMMLFVLAAICLLLRNGFSFSAYINNEKLITIFMLALLLAVLRMTADMSLSLNGDHVLVIVLLFINLLLAPYVDVFMILILVCVIWWNGNNRMNGRFFLTSTYDFLIYDKCLITIYSIYILAYYIRIISLQDFVIEPFALDHYYMSYPEYGFVQRGLIGTLIRFCFGYFIPQTYMKYIVFAIYNISLLGLYVFVIYIFQRFVKQTSILNPILWIFLLKIFPSMLLYHQGRLDILIALIGIIQIILAFRNNRSIWFVVPLTIISLLIHPVYAFIVFPVVFVLLCIRSFLVCEKHEVRNRLILIFTICFAAGLFIYFTVFSYKVVPVDIEAAKKVFCERTGSGIDDGAFWKEENLFFRSGNILNLGSHIRYFSGQMLGTYIKETLIKLVICILPLFFICCRTYKYWSGLYDDKYKRVICRALPYVFLSMIILYITEIDHGRWSLYLLLMLCEAVCFPFLIAQGGKKEENMIKISDTQMIVMSLAFLLFSCSYNLFGIFA